MKLPIEMRVDEPPPILGRWRNVNIVARLVGVSDYPFLRIHAVLLLTR